MDAPPDEDVLVRRVLASASPAVVLVGPAACGKTTAAIALHEHFRAAGAGALLVAPNAPAAAQLRRRLLERSPAGVVVAPEVLTFDALAGRVLAAAGDDGRLLPTFRRRLLLRQILDDLHAGGRLGALGAVADTPGVIESLDRAIAELKRAAVEPDALARAVGRGSGRTHDLLTVYRLYQQRMRDARSYDIEGRMWQARDCLAAARGAPPPGVADVGAVIVDGFTDFTPTQLEMLALLAGGGRRVAITLPGADDGRDRLWHWTRRTLESIRAALGEGLEIIRVENGSPAPLAALTRRIFDHEAEPCGLPAGLAVIAAPNLEAEVSAVASRVKRRLLDGAPAGSIAVLARPMGTYREPVERLFAEHDVPLASAPAALTDAPIVRHLLAVAALPREFAFRDVLRCIKSSYFLPAALGGYGGETVAAAETIIREGNVLAGRGAYAGAAERLARRAERPAFAGGEDAEDAEPTALSRAGAAMFRQAGEMLERLFDAAAGGDLAVLAEKLQLRRAALAHGQDDLLARDLRALAALEAALRDCGEPAPPAAQLREALSAVTCPAARGESVVDVLDVLDARALRYGHVFLLGMSEGQFPLRPAEGALIAESDRLAWAGRGVGLASRSDLTAREMLLCYLATSRADRTLTVSYLATDPSGAPSAESSFLASLLAPAGGLDAPRVQAVTERIPPGRLLPAAKDLTSRRDAAIAAVAALFGAETDAGPAALAWAAAHAPDTVRRAAGGLWAQTRRLARGPCDEFDGRISEDDLLAGLGTRFGRGAAFSATQLNAYGQCPWQFFATVVLALEPLREPQRRLEAVARGIFCHNVLFDVMTRLRGAAGGAVRPAEVDGDRLEEALTEAVAAEAAKVEATQPPYPALWQLQRQQMQEELLGYLLAWRGGAEPSREAAHFELGFGPGGEAAGATDPASSPEPVAVDTAAGPVRVSGRIDRVDRLVADGEERLLVIDYKTGRLPSQADIDAGRNVQMYLYAEAAERLLGQPCLGGVFQQVRDGKERHFSALKPPRSDHRSFEERRAAAAETVGRFVEGIRAGRFDLLPTHDCPSYCPFRQACQYARARAELKVPAASGEDPP